MQLSELRPGASFRVGKVLVGGEIGKRLADMGFTEGAEGELVRSAFLRGPVQVRIRGYDLLVRRSEARLIEIEGAGGGGKTQTGRDRTGRGGGYRPNRGRGFGLRALFAPQDCCGGRGGGKGQTGRDRIGQGGGGKGQTGRDRIGQGGGGKTQTGQDRIGQDTGGQGRPE
jgi:Fe2+ transport system protein FeoA